MNSTMTLSAPAKGRRIWIATILGLLSGIGPLSIDMYLPGLPALASELSASTSITQLSLTSCLIGLAVGQLIVGPISDVKGRRVPLIIGIAAYAVVSLLCMFSVNIWIFISMRFLQGIAGAAAIVIARASVRDMYSGVQLTKFFALLMLVNGAAPILAPILGAEILQYTSWRGIFGVLSGLGIILLFLVYFGLKETLPEDRRSSAGLKNTLLTFRRLATDRSFMGFALTQGFVMAAMFAYISGSSFVLQEHFGVSERMFSLVFGINGAGIILASQMTGRMAGRVDTRKLLGTGLILTSVGAGLLFGAALFQLGLYFVIVAFFLMVSSVGVITATATSLALQDQGQSAGSASAMLGMMSFISGGIVAPLVGIGETTSLFPLAIVSCALVALAIICFRFLTIKR